MDFHAHMNMNEVIGLLAGECHEDRRLIRSASSAVIHLVRRAEHALYDGSCLTACFYSCKVTFPDDLHKIWIGPNHPPTLTAVHLSCVSCQT